MAKTSTLPKLEDWTAPWETEGEDFDPENFDNEKARRYVYGLLSDKGRLQSRVAERDAKIGELETSLEEAESAGGDGKDTPEVERLRRENDKLKAKNEKDQSNSLEVMKLRVALRKGLSETQAKRLVGTTEDELEDDADELLESFGGAGKQADDDEDNKGGEDKSKSGARRRPRRLSNSGDPDPDADEDVPVDEGLKRIPRL